jgi:hypothetical protein
MGRKHQSGWQHAFKAVAELLGEFARALLK